MNIFSNRFRIAAFLAVAAVSLICACQAAAASAAKETEKLMPPRTAVCFYDGESFDDLVLNARGKITFLYVDGKLAGALKRQRQAERSSGGLSGIPPQIFSYATQSKKKHVLFIARVQALKGWKFDPSMLSAGGYSPVKEDIITGISDNPAVELKFGERELPKGYNGFIGFFVPVENVKPGETIKLGYAEDRVDWQVPDKNQ